MISKSMILLLTMMLLAVCTASTQADDVRVPEAADDSTVIDASKITFPNILAQKRILSSDIVAGDRVEVELSLYNIGSVPAVDILIEENEWDSAILLESAENKHRVARLGVYESVSISYYIRVPSEEGEYRGGPAKVTYRKEEKVADAAAEGSADLDATLAPETTAWQVSYSTQIYEDAELPYDRMKREDTAVRGTEGGVSATAGKLRVLSQKAFNQRHAHHIKEVALFLVLLLVPIGLPYYFYYIRSRELQLALSAATLSSPSKKAH